MWWMLGLISLPVQSKKSQTFSFSDWYITGLTFNVDHLLFMGKKRKKKSSRVQE